MNSHTDIRKLLSPYCGGDLPTHERSMVEEHLKKCPACRAILADLQTTLHLVRTTPEIEPPPWMTARIMAHVREQVPRRRLWYQRFFFPLRIRIPLEAAALLVVCLTGYYLSQTVETELKAPRNLQDVPAPAPPAEIPRKKDIRIKPAAPAPEKATHQVRDGKSVDRPAPASSQPPAVPSAQAPVLRSVTQDHAAPATTAAPEPARSAREEKSGIRMLEAAPEMKKKSEKKTMRQDAESGASTPAGRPAGADADRYQPQLILRLTVSDRSTAAEAIRTAAIRSGATIVDDAVLPASRIRLRIPAARMTELFEQIDRIGRLADRPRQQGSAQELDVTIQW
ncbi:MAG: DUF2275 domain-containing protein [Desulfuromonadales bacterium]